MRRKRSGTSFNCFSYSANKVGGTRRGVALPFQNERISPILSKKNTRRLFVDVGGGKPTLADENNDDQRDKWVDERRGGKGREGYG